MFKSNICQPFLSTNREIVSRCGDTQSRAASTLTTFEPASSEIDTCFCADIKLAGMDPSINGIFPVFRILNEFKGFSELFVGIPLATDYLIIHVFAPCLTVYQYCSTKQCICQPVFQCFSVSKILYFSMAPNISLWRNLTNQKPRSSTDCIMPSRNQKGLIIVNSV